MPATDRPHDRPRPDHRARNLPEPLADAFKTRATTDGIPEGYLAFTFLTLACIELRAGRGHRLPPDITRRPPRGPIKQVRWTQKEASYQHYRSLIEDEAGSSLALVLCSAAAVYVEHGMVDEVWLHVPWQDPPGTLSDPCETGPDGPR